jgi:hypothetical protein
MPARSHTQGKKNAIMEDMVFQELPHDFCDTPPDRASYRVKLHDSDFESARTKKVIIITFIPFCSCMRTRDVVLSNLMCISSCFFCISPFYYFNAMSSICVILPNHG